MFILFFYICYGGPRDLPVLTHSSPTRRSSDLVGTHAVLPAADRDRVAGYLINRFRGDASLFADGLSAISGRTGWPSFGIVPWFADAARLDRKSTRLNSSHSCAPRMPFSAWKKNKQHTLHSTHKCRDNID